MSVEQLYNLDFYVYHLRPYGIVSGLQELNQHEVKPTPTAGPPRLKPTPATDLEWIDKLS